MQELSENELKILTYLFIEKSLYYYDLQSLVGTNDSVDSLIDKGLIKAEEGSCGRLKQENYYEISRKGKEVLEELAIHNIGIRNLFSEKEGSD